jgi:hypothetical protein
MLRIPVQVRTSQIHGEGIFALTDIRKGALLWEFDPGLDRRISSFAVKHAEPRVRDYIMERGYINPRQPDQIVLCLDEAQFWNFPPAGEEANTSLGERLDGENVIVAARNIVGGEEITIPPESDFDYERKVSAKG